MMTTVPSCALRATATAACLLMLGTGAQAFKFEAGDVRGSFDSTLTAGTGIRLLDPNCGLIAAGASGSGAPTGCLATSQASSLGDQGDLNYKKGRPFTSYLKGSHELLLKAPDDLTFMGRVNWLRDFSAARTSGYLGTDAPASNLTDGLATDARRDLKFKARVLDLWVSKAFDVGSERARVRVGNQVISWGESLFLPGGVNTINALDIMRLSQPGTQLKEAVLPAPMISVASGLGKGLNIEAYVQTRWNASYFPPTGSYWSNANGLGKGHSAYGPPPGLVEARPKDGGQGGVALRYQPEGTQLNLGLYAVAYQDKAPNFSYNAGGPGLWGWEYAENRRMFGISANMPVGDWAVGTELSYRPKDAVSLNSASNCTSQGGRCWVDEKKIQWNLTGMLSLTPNAGKPVLDLLGADTATLMIESAVVSYPKLKQTYGGDPISAGAWGWGLEYAGFAGTPEAVGSKTSWGYNFDFSWVYDGTVIPGWQVVPELFYFQAVKGRTPNAAGQFMEGAKSLNFTVSFIQNPANWQASINYAAFFGGKRVFDQTLRDRNFIGLTLSRNF